MSSKYELHHQAFGWTHKVDWLAPAGDLSTPVHFDIVTKETAEIIRSLDPERLNTCIQAGGNIGLWPWRYSQVFRHVITYEPCEENFYC